MTCKAAIQLDAVHKMLSSRSCQVKADLYRAVHQTDSPNGFNHCEMVLATPEEHSLQVYTYADIWKVLVAVAVCWLSWLLLSCSYVGHECRDMQALTLTGTERKGWTT